MEGAREGERESSRRWGQGQRVAVALWWAASVLAFAFGLSGGIGDDFVKGFECFAELSITSSSGRDLVVEVLSEVVFKTTCRMYKFQHR